jgi:predicted ATPase/class 3 adenylate cyclase
MDANTTRQLPEGSVTLLFTDIEGSTRLLHRIGEVYGDVLTDHDRLLREVWTAHDGVVVDTEGDAFFVAFRDAQSALSAAASAQEALGAHRWPHRGRVCVRMGVHTGTPRLRDGNYWGVDVHYAARLCSAAHGGQVLLSAATRMLARDVSADDLGEHALKDFPVARKLYHLNLAGRPSASFPPPRTLEIVRTNLPSSLTPLVGREGELETVSAKFAGGVRLLTITGVGGSGKTRLALASGARLLETHADGVFLVTLASVDDESEVATAIARAVGAIFEDGSDPEPALADHLARRELVVIIDNMEHLLGAAPLLSRLLEAAPGLRLLVTSQTPLRVRGEVVMKLGPLGLARLGEHDPIVLESAPSVALLLERTRAVDPSFMLTVENASAIADVCRRLGGLPLALELAAARMPLGGAPQVLAALERGLDALGSGARDVPERQRGLRAAMDWTVSLLDRDERALFAGLSAFADSWTLEQLERMFGADMDVWEASAVLLDFALIRRRGDGRFMMAETVHIYASGLLEEQGRTEECRKRHATMLAEEAEAIHDELFLNERELVARTVDLHGEFSAALAWTASADPILHRRLVGALGTPFYLAGHLSELAAEVTALFAADDAADDVSARLALSEAFVLISKSDTAGSAIAAGRAAEIRHQIGDQSGAAQATTLQIEALLLSSAKPDVAHARELLDTTMRLPAVRADPRLDGLLRYALAVSHSVTGSLDEAERMLADIIAEPHRTDHGAVAAMSVWADCALSRGRYEDALSRYTETLRSVRGTQFFNTLLQCWGIAAALAGLGRDGEAIAIVETIHAVGERDGAVELREEVAPWTGAEMLGAARTRLGDLAVARAREGARRRDLDDLVALALSTAATAAAAPAR